MAINPINLPGNMGVNAGLNQLTEGLRDYNEWQEHRKRMLLEKGYRDAQMKLQQDQHALNERAQTRQEAGMQVDAIAKLRQTKDPVLRAAIIRAAGGELTGMEDVFGDRPQTQINMSDADLEDIGHMAMQQAQPQGGSALPDSIDHGRSMNPMAAASQAQHADQQRLAGLAKNGGRMPQPQPQSDADHYRQVMGEEMPEMPKAPLLGKKISFKLGGQEMTLDPREEMAMAEAERGRNQAALSAAFTDPKYQKVAASLAQVPGITPDLIVKGVLDQMEKDQSDVTRREEGAANRESRLEGTKLIADAMRAGKATITPPQKADDKRADVTAFAGDYNKWEAQGNVDKLTDAYDKFSEMRAAVEAHRRSGDVINQRNALYQAARYITGPGVLTASEFENTVQRTGGLVASALSKLQKNLDGQVSEQEAAALDKFVQNANGAVKGRAVRSVQNFDRKYGVGSYYAGQVPDEVANARAALLERFGLTDQDVAGSTRAKAGGGKVGTGPLNISAELDSIFGPKKKAP